MALKQQRQNGSVESRKTVAEEILRLQGTKEELMELIPQLLGVYQLIQSRDIGTIYGTPSTEFQAQRKFKPQVELHFLQDSDFVPGQQSDVPKGQRRKRGEIKFRVMDEDTETITKSNAKVIANKVKAIFIANGGFIWQKGRVMCAYTDHERGYGLQLRCKSESEGRRVVQQVLQVQGHSPDWTRFTVTENADPLARYPVSPGTQVIMGETVWKPQYRPVVDVRFQYAVMHVHGLPYPVPLCDRVNKLIEPLAD